jgi:hypothetical protein
MMDKTKIQELRELAQKATPGQSYAVFALAASPAVVLELLDIAERATAAPAEKINTPEFAKLLIATYRCVQDGRKSRDMGMLLKLQKAEDALYAHIAQRFTAQREAGRQEGAAAPGLRVAHAELCDKFSALSAESVSDGLTIIELRARAEAAEAALNDVYGAFSIGEQAREPHILIENLRNVMRRADCLDAIEREFFMVEVPPDADEGDTEPGEECRMRWGVGPREYVEQFRAALASRPAVDLSGLTRYALNAGQGACCMVHDDAFGDFFMVDDVQALLAQGGQNFPHPKCDEACHHVCTEGGQQAPECAAPGEWEHASNEWADVATNGLQWLKDVANGTSKLPDAIAAMQRDIKAVRAALPRPADGAPTTRTGDVPQKFQHKGGKFYEKLGELSAKIGNTGWREGCVHYRSMDDGKEYVTDLTRWNFSFKPVFDSPAAKSAADLKEAAPVPGELPPLLWALLNAEGQIEFSHASRETVAYNQPYIKTPTRVVGLVPQDIARQARADALEEAARWTPVAERAPSEGQLVLIAGPIPPDLTDAKLKGWRCCARFVDGGFLDGNGCTRDSATHWMPLVDSPYDAIRALNKKG